MADEQRHRRRRQEDTELADVLQFLGDLEKLGEKYDAGQEDCRRMFAELDDKIDKKILPLLADLQRKIDGDPLDRERFPGLNAVVHDLAEVEAAREVRAQVEEAQRARRRLAIGTITTIAGGGVFGLLALILSVLRQVTP